ncbi:MAG: YncE family protein [Bacteroidia bacterium]
MQRIFFIFFFILLLYSCEKALDTVRNPAIVPSLQGGIFIINEGGFNNGNASLSFYDFTSQTVSDDVFFSVNNRHLGDVFQSVSIGNGSAYLVMNNSKKIEVIDASTFQLKATITGFNSPRYLTFINSAKAYVSDLYDNSISVVDLQTNSISKKIPCLAGTEQMLLVNQKIFVTNTKQNSVYVFDPVLDILTDSIPVSFGSNSLVMDKNNKLWILCSGDKASNKMAGLYRINPLNDSVEFFLKNMYPSGIFGASKLCINGTKDRLYWLNLDIQTISITDTAIASSPFVHSVNNTFYGLGVDSGSGRIYVSDAMNFIQRSTISIYNTSGELKGMIRGGINTNGFYFYYR